jgi:hypothetical protein
MLAIAARRSRDADGEPEADGEPKADGEPEGADAGARGLAESTHLSNGT